MAKYFVQHANYNTFLNKLRSQGTAGQTAAAWLEEGAGVTFGAQLRFAIENSLGEQVDLIRDQIVTFGGLASAEVTALNNAIDGADGIMTAVTTAQMLPMFRLDLTSPAAAGGDIAGIVQRALQNVFSEETAARGGGSVPGLAASAPAATDDALFSAIIALARSVTALARSV